MLLPTSFLALFLSVPPLLGQENQSVLYVGVRSLPEYLSPALAFTWTERQMLDLLFERLVEPVEDERGVQQFRPRLAADMPRVSPLQREFHIRPGACWPDGRQVTSTDVRDTLLRLKQKNWVGRSALWSSLDSRDDGDPSRIRLTFESGMFEPLSSMSFYVLPQHYRKKQFALDDVEFAKVPVGSGPYFVDSMRHKEDDREYVVLKRNPKYEFQGRKPAFSEIRLFVARNGAKEFFHPTKPMHCWLDAPPAEAGAKDRPLRSRRVYFLAVKQQEGTALASVELRRGIALAIDRKSILDKCFKGARHVALNGPYPADSWACSKKALDVPPNLFNPELAQSKLGEHDVALTLKYPDDDPRVEQACREIQAQIKKAIGKDKRGVRLELAKRSPGQLKKDVDDRAYELAYYHIDYPDNTFTLWPLFEDSEDALSKGGANFLMARSPSLQAVFGKLRGGSSDFKTVQERTHQVPSNIVEGMHLIPLWQIDTHVVFRGVDPGDRFDRQRVFTNIERWKLER
jgi:ABC-type oligopeptide transport system substrate-binding subunit